MWGVLRYCCCSVDEPVQGLSTALRHPWLRSSQQQRSTRQPAALSALVSSMRLKNKQILAAGAQVKEAQMNLACSAVGQQHLSSQKK